MNNFFKKHWIETLFFTALFAIYYYTCAETVTGEDSASFHLSLIKFGINHPPGYPLYTLLGSSFVHGLSFLTPLEPSHLVNLFSSMCSFATLVILFFMLKDLKFEKVISLFIVAATAFSFCLWSQANVAEVYSLNLLLCVGTIYAFFKFVTSLESDDGEVSTKTDRLAFLVSLLSGLSLANHYPLFILTFGPIVLFYLIALPNELLKKFFMRKKCALNLLFLIIGLLPYAFMYIYSIHFEPAYSFKAIDTPKEFYEHVMRKSYSVVDFQNSGISGKVEYFLFSLKLAIENMRGFVIFLIAGFFYLFKSKVPFLKASLFGAMGSIIALPLILSFPDNELYHAVFRVYPYVGYPLLFMISALGMSKLYEKKKNVVLVLAVLFLGEQFVTNLPRASRTGDISNLNYSKIYLDSIPKNARVLLDGDEGFSLYYLNQIHGVRKDLEMISFQNSYTTTKIFTRAEYERATINPSIAIQLRVDKINKYLGDDRILFSTSKVGFEQAKIPYKAWVFGYVADTGGQSIASLGQLNQKYFTTEFITSLVPRYPINDYWSKKNTSNTLASLIGLSTFFGNDAMKTYVDLVNSERGKQRTDIFDDKNMFILRNMGYKLFEFQRYDQATKVYDYIRKNFGDESMEKTDKFMYCKSLYLLNKIHIAGGFCMNIK